MVFVNWGDLSDSDMSHVDSESMADVPDYLMGTDMGNFACNVVVDEATVNAPDLLPWTEVQLRLLMISKEEGLEPAATDSVQDEVFDAIGYDSAYLVSSAFSDSADSDTQNNFGYNQ